MYMEIYIYTHVYRNIRYMYGTYEKKPCLIPERFILHPATSQKGIMGSVLDMMVPFVGTLNIREPPCTRNLKREPEFRESPRVLLDILHTA